MGKERIAYEVSIGLGQYFAFVGVNWHEIITWFGFIYYDNASVETATNVGIERRAVNLKTVLEVPLVTGGGQAVWITPNIESSARENYN